MAWARRAAAAAGLVVLGLAAAGARAEPPSGATASVEVVRSRSLGREATVRVYLPRRAIEGPSPVAILIADAESAERAAREALQQELETASYGAVILAVEPQAGPGFEAFVVDELMPQAAARWPGGQRLLVGEGAGGAFVLRMAAQRPDLVDAHFAVCPTLSEGDAARILARARPHPRGHAGAVDVDTHPCGGTPGAELSRIAEYLGENGHAAWVYESPDDSVSMGRWIAAQALVPPT